jgi:hypothetical protein
LSFWLFTGSQGGSGVPSSGGESERDALVEEAAAQAAQLVQQSDGDEALARRSEVRNLRFPVLPRFDCRVFFGFREFWSVVI